MIIKQKSIRHPLCFGGGAFYLIYWLPNNYQSRGNCESRSGEGLAPSNLPLRSIPSGASAIHPFTRPRAATGFPGTPSKLLLRFHPERQRRISKPIETLQSAGGGEKCSNKRLRPNHFPPPPALLPLPSPPVPGAHLRCESAPHVPEYGTSGAIYPLFCSRRP